MAKSITCDNCGTTLVLDLGNEDAAGEAAAWLSVGSSIKTWDACTRQCAHELLDGPVAKVVNEWAEVITGIARTIRENRDSDG